MSTIMENPEDAATIGQLRERATSIRRMILSMLEKAGSGHSGGSLSATDIVTALYFHHLRHDPHNPRWEDRDRFILSKGHCAPVLYAVLAECGYFPHSWLDHLRKMGHPLQGHPDMKKTPGVEVSTGSLGQGLSVGCGMAWSARMNASPSHVYVLLGDGECDEGQVWEAAMFVHHYKLDNLTAIIDRNRLQVDGETESVMSLEPLSDKWRAFGWRVTEIDGHNMAEILEALAWTRESEGSGVPTAMIARTVKGKGVSFMEGKVDWHGAAPNSEQLRAALEELT